MCAAVLLQQPPGAGESGKKITPAAKKHGCRGAGFRESGGGFPREAVSKVKTDF